MVAGAIVAQGSPSQIKVSQLLCVLLQLSEAAHERHGALVREHNCVRQRKVLGLHHMYTRTGHKEDTQDSLSMLSPCMSRSSVDPACFLRRDTPCSTLKLME